MATLVFKFNDAIIPTSQLIITRDTLGHFAEWISNALESYDLDAVNNPANFVLALDMPMLSEASATDVVAAIKGYERLYEHINISVNGLSHYYPAVAVATADAVLKSLTWTSRCILLNLFHYLDNRNLFELTSHSFCELLAGHSVEDVRRFTGYEHAERPSKKQLEKLKNLYGGES